MDMSTGEIILTDDEFHQQHNNSSEDELQEVIDAQYKLLGALYKDISNSIVPGIIKQLQELKDDALLSGEDSGLENVWEEICAQLQRGPSFEWQMYVLTVEGIIDEELNKLPHSFKQVISYLSDFNDEPEMTGYSPFNAIESIKNDVFSVAMDYSNLNIEEYLYG
jgi:hypothetical protein